MLIVSLKPGHDGTVAVVKDGVLQASLEAEKDSFPRYDRLGPTHFLEAMSYTQEIPDVFCISGWPKGIHSVERSLGAGYFGSERDSSKVTQQRVFGKDVSVFWSTHERSHIYCAVGLSPYADLRDCYCLVWEGNIGRFYHVSKDGVATAFPPVMVDPGNKYAFLYSLADPTSPASKGLLRLEDAGKLMALAAFGADSPPSPQQEHVIDWILSRDDGIILNHSKSELIDSGYYNIGVRDPDFCNLARQFSDRLFDQFHKFAKSNLTEGLPLVIAGGCGLNCDWNHKWRQTGMFDGLFVPPCPNDTGSAIGTAAEAQWHFSGRTKLDWSVYAGQEFVMDGDFASLGVKRHDLDPAAVAQDLSRGEVIALVQGRCEIGPRALGNRSLIAEPYSEKTRDRLSEIKGRESFRPIAPVVLEDQTHQHFQGHTPSPYMLEFAQVIDPRLKAITHVDGSARPQTVTPEQNPLLCNLLVAFKALTGCAVLCNTSLNFNGRGFINRLTDLVEYCRSRGILRAVVENSYLIIE